MARIITLGSLNLDFTYQLPKPLEVGETLSSLSYRCGAGGKGANQSIAAARAGAEVYHAGRIGSDGTLLRRTLADSGVRLDFLEEVETPTGHAVVLINDAGDNSIVLFGGANRTIDETFIDRVTSAAKPGDILLLQNEINELPYLVEKAHERGMRIVLNPSPMDEKIFALPLELIDYFLLNETEAAELLKHDGHSETDDMDALADALAKRFPKASIVLTIGSDGAIFTNGTKKFRQPSFPVKAVDTTAAGDTFSGYFIARILEGSSEEQAMEMAARAASIAVTRRGAAPSIPERKEVEAAGRSGIA